MHFTVRRGDFHEPNVLSGDGKAAVRIRHYCHQTACALCAAAIAPESNIWFRRNDLGTAGYGGDHDDNFRLDAVSHDLQGGRKNCRVINHYSFGSRQYFSRADIRFL